MLCSSDVAQLASGAAQGLKLHTGSSQLTALIPPLPSPFPVFSAHIQNSLDHRLQCNCNASTHSLQTWLIPPRLLSSCISINLHLSLTIAQFSLFIYLPVDSFYNLSLDSHRARDRTRCYGMHWMPTSLVECASILMQWKGPFVNMPCDQRADACWYFQY